MTIFGVAEFNSCSGLFVAGPEHYSMLFVAGLAWKNIMEKPFAMVLLIYNLVTP